MEKSIFWHLQHVGFTTALQNDCTKEVRPMQGSNQRATFHYLRSEKREDTASRYD